jgi:RNA polymerase sigma-70 factor (ECF subfamily)
MKRRIMSKGTTMTAVSEEGLMERLALGDQGALKQLMERWSKPVYSLALHILRDPGLAEAVTQDVFLRDCTWGAGFEESQGNFSSWLLSVTRKRALVLIRSRKAFGAELAQAAPAASLGQALSKTCLGQLDDAQRQVVTLAYFEGLSREEMAERLAVPLATVKSLLQEAMAQLRGVLSDPEQAGALAAARAESLAGGSWAPTPGGAV